MRAILYPEHTFCSAPFIRARSRTALVEGLRKPKGFSSQCDTDAVIEVCNGSNSQFVRGARFVTIAQFGAFRCVSKLALLLFEGGGEGPLENTFKTCHPLCSCVVVK